MDCRKSQRWIALHVEGDLAGRKVARVERHLSECAECREFAAALAASQGAVKEFGAEPVDETALREVRARVLAQVAAERPRAAFPVWRWAAAAACLAAISGTGYVIPKFAAVVPPPGPGPVAVVRPAVPPPADRAPVARAVRVRRPKPPAMKATEPLLVKLVTDDPNVVIYWIVGE